MIPRRLASLLGITSIANGAVIYQITPLWSLVLTFLGGLLYLYGYPEERK